MRLQYVLWAVLFSSVTAVSAQSPKLLKDINKGKAASNPRRLCVTRDSSNFPASLELSNPMHWTLGR